MIRILKTIQSGDVIPRGYGVAWIDAYTPRAHCLPVPLNLIVRAARAAWLRAKFPMSGAASIRDAYAQGWRDCARAFRQPPIAGYQPVPDEPWLFRPPSPKAPPRKP